jgi:hypothetical protein
MSLWEEARDNFIKDLQEKGTDKQTIDQFSKRRLHQMMSSVVAFLCKLTPTESMEKWKLLGGLYQQFG